ncbi:winged helix-turn-helix domain-containing protein [Yunchengibacter salinarum]|uniref:winged helix-turn-helix domain-containing protein n=1 Tax=Yunchengibacter salinarum TaxID=3133399 RepID=UPI0035B6A23E
MAGYDVSKLDDVIHSKARLAIMSYLMTADPCDFTDLKTQLGLSDGNLSTHLRKLESSGYIQMEKTYRGRKPLTRLRPTAAGKKAFRAHVEGLARLLGPSLGGSGPD